MIPDGYTEIESNPISAATAAVKSVLALLEPQGALPADIWHDPFALGFVFYLSHAASVIAGTDPKDFENAPSIYMDLCGRDGIEILKRTMVFSMDEDADYVSGLTAGDKLFAVTNGSTAYDDDPDIRAIRRIIAETRDTLPDTGDISEPDIEGAYLLEALFLAPLRRRLGLEPVLH